MSGELRRGTETEKGLRDMPVPQDGKSVLSSTVEAISGEVSRPQPPPGRQYRKRLPRQASAGIGVVVLAFIVLGTQVRELRKHKRPPQNAAERLRAAASVGKVGDVKSLLSKGVDVNSQDERGYTPLHYAAMFGQTRIVELMVSRGADVNTTNKENMTPLHVAPCRSQKAVVKTLLAKGADVNARDGAGATPLAEATSRGHTEVAELLRRHGGT